MNATLLLIVIGLQVFILYYLIRTARNLGSKTTKYHREVLSNINSIKELQLKSSGNTLLNHLIPVPGSNIKEFNWDYVVSLTSYPARFSTLSKSISSISSQRLIPKKIYLNIAQADIAKLPAEVKALEGTGTLIINACNDLGPGKKLIPTLINEPELPIIVFDDDLYLEADLTLKLMIQHHLTPHCVIASRVHKVKYDKNGKFLPYEKWVKNFNSASGPDLDLFPTSGAGTLYKKSFFHDDVIKENEYKELSFHTDDLWWYIQSRRINTKTKKLSGFSFLDYIEETQASGLWQTGNQIRNDENLTKLLKKYNI
jgi:hypothetical protein